MRNNLSCELMTTRRIKWAVLICPATHKSILAERTQRPRQIELAFLFIGSDSAAGLNRPEAVN
jgi:hypothetical protein